jgi:hypothetical protein
MKLSDVFPSSSEFIRGHSLIKQLYGALHIIQRIKQI